MAAEPLELGAVYTPPWLVRRVLDRTLDPLLEGCTEAELRALRLIDPACGDGAFLVEAGRRIVGALCLVHGASNPRWMRRARREVVERCLMGVDIDEQAVAAAHDALLHWAGEGATGTAGLRRSLERNVLAGNALAAATGSGALCWRGEHGPGEVMRGGGFHVVVGNPPFLEPKRYRRVLPGIDGALRAAGFCTVGPGRVDLALPFLELGAALLRSGGRLGFVIQSRFFRAEYGRAARRWLVERGLLLEIDDYGEAPIFPGRATYTAAVILASPRRNRGTARRAVRVGVFLDLEAARRGRPHHSTRLPFEDLGSSPWCFARPGFEALRRELERRHGRLGDHPVRIGVGLQLPLRRVYQLEPLALEDGWLHARNGLGEELRIERDALRPLCRNRRFYPLRADNRDAYVIFPYGVEGGSSRELRFDDWSHRFPSAAAYLRRHRAQLAATAVPEGRGRWHLFRYPKNLVAQSRPKVLFPTTALETAAAVDDAGEIYTDNVRVLFLQGPVELLALAALLSSTPFSALARQQAALSENGWRQLNRQYLAAVPFPFARLQADSAVLAALAAEIRGRQQAALAEGELREPEAAELHALWLRLDERCAELYGLSSTERAVLESEPRRVCRVELLRSRC